MNEESGTGPRRQPRAGKKKATSAKSKRTPRGEKVNGSDASIAFLQRAFAGRDGYISVTAIHPTNLRDISTKSAPISNVASLANFIAANNGKRNLYWSVNRVRSALSKKAEKKDVATMDFLHVDLDPRDGEPIEAERVRIKALIDRFEPMPNIIINSGAGYGCFWRLREPPAVDGNFEELEAYNKRLAEDLGGDNCHNVDRIMRLPGTTNLPTPRKIAKGRGVYEASLVYVDDRAYTLADFEPAGSRKQEPPLSSAIPLRIAALAGRLPLLKRRLAGDTSGMKDTSRSALDYSIAAMLVKERCFDDEIFATLKGYGHGKAHEEKDDYIYRMIRKLRPEGHSTARTEPFNPDINSVAALQTLDEPDLQWVIPGMLPEGLTILGGRPKQGKSRMALNISAAVAQGGKAFGSEQVSQGRVLMLALEDSKRRLKKRFIEINAWPQPLDYATKWERGNVAAFEAYLDEHADTKLIVIDTYGRWSPPATRDRLASAYDVDVANLSILQGIAMDRHIAIVLVMHTRKSEASDVVDEISGSTGLSGTADTIWVLKRVRGENLATLHVTGRDVEDEVYALEWDVRLYCWKLVGKARDVIMSKERQQVLDVLWKHRDGLTPSRLGLILGGKSRQSAFKLLNGLLDDGLVKDIDGKYFVVKPDGTI